LQVTDELRGCTHKGAGWRSWFHSWKFLRIQILFQNALDGHVRWIIKTHRPATGHFQSLWAEPFGQAQQSSSGAQPIFGLVVEQTVHHLACGWADLGCLLSTAITVDEQSRNLLWR
jgi:hypothetical protein